MIHATDSKGTFYILNKKDRTPIIFIHGVGLDHSIWDLQINAFDNIALFVISALISGDGKATKTKINIVFLIKFADNLIIFLI